MVDTTVIVLTYLQRPELRESPIVKYLTLLDLPPYLPFDMYLVDPLRRIFKKVVVYDYIERITHAGLRGANEELIDLVRRERPRYVIWASWKYDIQHSTFEAIRREGSAVVGWFFDDEWRFDEYSKWWIPHMDYCVTNSELAVPLYRSLGARVFHTVPNTGISINPHWGNNAEKYDVSFVGSVRYADRQRFIRALNRAGISTHLFGTGSDAGYVSFDRMIEIFQTSKINLNFSKDWNRLRPQVKGRVFQACMAGGFVLTEYAPGLERYFELDQEVVCFTTAREMIEKITYYLRQDGERRAIARAGWKRAIREYTSEIMVAKVFEAIERDRTATTGGSHVSIRRALPPPRDVRWRHSLYYLRWARAFLEEGYPRQFWNDALGLALTYNRLNFVAWCVRLALTLPFPLRRTVLSGYHQMERILAKLARLWLDHLRWVWREVQESWLSHEIDL